jgi:hypothetical protein
LELKAGLQPAGLSQRNIVVVIPLSLASISGKKAFDNHVMASNCQCGDSFSIHPVVLINKESAECLMSLPLTQKKLVFNLKPQVFVFACGLLHRGFVEPPSSHQDS